MSNRFKYICENKYYIVYKSNIGQCYVIVRDKRNANNNIRFDNLEEFENFIKEVNDVILQD